MSLKKIDSNIKRIVTNAAKLNVLIHETALLVLGHAAEHGDCTRALALVKAMPASHRRTMLIAWFDKYSPIRVILANDKVGMLKDTAKGFVAFNVEGATAEPFYAIAEATPEKPPFDLNAMLKFIESAAKRVQTQIDEGRVPDADVSTAQALIASIKAVKVERVVPANDPNNIELAPAANA